jgi:predicted ATPase/class 3 adenylate cyclase
MTALPTGTVTFLFTDIEGSTARWEGQPEAMRVALARHDALIRSAIGEHHGHVVKTMGDAFHAAFARATDALAAALDAQRRLAAEPWGEVGPLRVRMALHTGVSEERDGDYFGPTLNRVARLLSAGHGGQVLLSEATAGLVRDALPDGVRLLDLGWHRLRDLTEPERVSQVVAPDLASDFPTLASLDARPHNLPTHPTALLGRERELAEVRRLFGDGARLVTLTGPGGTGKTRLGLQVAAELLDDFEHGAFLVELAPISDPALVASTIAQALGVRDVGSRPVMDTLKEYLRARSLLLLLDNFEQVVAAAPIVADILAACPGLAALVTSREPLRVRGEREYAVPPLALPEAGQVTTPEVVSNAPAAVLFVQRARAIRADFALSDENAAAVAEICARLDGLPLAIELAAARIRLLAPDAMLSRLGHGLSLLSGGRRDLPTRQQTLRNAIAWSYDLLDGPERRLFRRLGVFVGGFTIDAAESVCAADDPGVDMLDGLESLIAKSLVKSQADVGSDSRFTMLATIREFALERLEESREIAAMRRRHAACVLRLAEDAAPKLEGAEQITWLDRLDIEADNVRAALTWSQAAGDFETGLRIAGALAWFWHFRGHAGEGRAWLAAALDAPTAQVAPATRVRALIAANVLVNVAGDTAECRRLGGEAVRIARELGDPRTLGRALTILASSTFFDDPATARQHYEEAIPILRAVGDNWGLAFALGPKVAAARAAGDYVAAHALHLEGAALSRQVGDRRAIGMALIGAAFTWRLQGDLTRAITLYQEALQPLHELGDRWMLARSLGGLAAVHSLQAEHRRAARIYGAAEALRETIGAPVNVSLRPDYDYRVADTRRALGATVFAAAWAEGRAMTLEQAVAYALEEQPSA